MQIRSGLVHLEPELIQFAMSLYDRANKFKNWRRALHQNQQEPADASTLPQRI